MKYFYFYKLNEMKKSILILFISFAIACKQSKPPIVFQSDFGLKDGAVSAMKGVSLGVNSELRLYDLTHEIPPYNIWEAAYRLEQTAPYWPSGTVFVSVVDPGVGTDRRSVVLKTKSGHYFVSPDNGSLTLVSKSLGIESLRVIDEELNRRKNSQQSYTFHGRDVYSYTAARLAAGVIDFDEVGKLLPPAVVTIDHQPAVIQGDSILGNIPILDVQYGNVWTNISDTLFRKLGIQPGEQIQVRLSNKDSVIYNGTMPYVATFGDVPANNPLCYLNSLMNVSFAVNMGSFAVLYRIQSGPQWKVVIKRNRLGK
jgi:S-adenosylmethionine hydrolase